MWPLDLTSYYPETERDPNPETERVTEPFFSTDEEEAEFDVPRWRNR